MTQPLEVGHVVPLNDLRDHEPNINCWCNPTEDEDYEGVWIHHAMDDRESYEQGRLLQ